MLARYLSLIKFSHTIFALPFALLGFTLGVLDAGTGFSWQKLLLVVACMVFARSAAMAFNRYLDRDIDAVNPRTQQREIPAGAISAGAALTFVVLNSALFVMTTYWINWLCLVLSPVALLTVLGYSYTKRFTAWCHFILGLGLSLAPLGAYLAVTGYFDGLPMLYSAAVLFWVAGFDIIYALQDEEFDRSQALNSIPAWLGKARALSVSSVIHLGSAAFLLAACWIQAQRHPDFNLLAWVGAAIFLALLFYQHTLVKVHDLSRVNLAFFTTNGIASVVFSSLVILDLFI